ncbi:unnamed protein product [Symbiodinium sp. KB8]|nr:unnamed protein product [Symbiodinium sp. KB8]
MPLHAFIILPLTQPWDPTHCPAVTFHGPGDYTWYQRIAARTVSCSGGFRRRREETSQLLTPGPVAPNARPQNENNGWRPLAVRLKNTVEGLADEEMEKVTARKCLRVVNLLGETDRRWRKLAKYGSEVFEWGGNQRQGGGMQRDRVSFSESDAGSGWRSLKRRLTRQQMLTIGGYLAHKKVSWPVGEGSSLEISVMGDICRFKEASERRALCFLTEGCILLSEGSTALTYDSPFIHLINEEEGFSSPGPDGESEAWSSTRIHNFNLRQEELRMFRARGP